MSALYYETVRVGRHWALVHCHPTTGGIGRQGWWCEDAAGGWGISGEGPARAVEMCIRSVVFRSKKEALESVGVYAGDAA